MTDRDGLPTNWVQTSVGEICTDLQYGYTASAKEQPCGPRFLRITDIQNGQVMWNAVPYCEIEKESVYKYALREGDIVFARTGGTVGKSFIISSIPEEAVFASYLIRLSAHPLIYPKFLYYFFQSASYWEQIGLKKGGLQGNVNAKTLSSLELELCSINEQHRIVAKIEELFSELDKGIESLKTARAQLKVYRQAVLKHAFEGKLTAQWRDENKNKLETADQLLARIQKERDARNQQQLEEWKTAVKEWEGKGGLGKKPTKPQKPILLERLHASDLPELPVGWIWVQYGALCSLIRNGISKKPVGTSGKKIFRISAVRPMEFDLDDVRYISDSDGEFSNYYLQQGDLVFTRYNGSRNYVGVCAQYQSDGSHLYPDKLIRTQLGIPSVLPGYIEKAANCGVSRHFIEEKIRTTAGQSGISGSDIKSMPVPLCNTAEQSIIQDCVEMELSNTSQMLSDINENIRRSETLRQSILKKAFSGQLVDQDPNDEPASILLERIKAEKTAQANARKLVQKRKPRRNVIPAQAAVRRIGIQNKTSA